MPGPSKYYKIVRHLYPRILVTHLNLKLLMGPIVDNMIISHLNLTLLTGSTVDTMIVIYLYPMLSTGPDEYDSNTPIS